MQIYPTVHSISVKPALSLDERAIQVQLLYCDAWAGTAVAAPSLLPRTPLLPSSTAQAVDVLLAYAVGMCHPRAISCQGSGGRWPTVSDWMGVAALVADLVHACATTLLGHAKAAVLTEMIAGCELAMAQNQERAEARHPPAVVCRGVELEGKLKQREVTVCG